MTSIHRVTVRCSAGTCNNIPVAVADLHPDGRWRLDDTVTMGPSGPATNGLHRWYESPSQSPKCAEQSHVDSRGRTIVVCPMCGDRLTISATKAQVVWRALADAGTGRVSLTILRQVAAKVRK